jgi:hypothetical protein
VSCVLQAVPPSPAPLPPPAVPSPTPPPGLPSPAPIPGAGTCGDTMPNEPGNQTFNCKQLGDYVLNENMTNVGPPSGSLCCMPRFSCIDINPDVPGCQPFYCEWFQSTAWLGLKTLLLARIDASHDLHALSASSYGHLTYILGTSFCAFVASPLILLFLSTQVTRQMGGTPTRMLTSAPTPPTKCAAW